MTELPDQFDSYREFDAWLMQHVGGWGDVTITKNEEGGIMSGSELNNQTVIYKNKKGDCDYFAATPEMEAVTFDTSNSENFLREDEPDSTLRGIWSAEDISEEEIDEVKEEITEEFSSKDLICGEVESEFDISIRLQQFPGYALVILSVVGMTDIVITDNSLPIAICRAIFEAYQEVN